MLRAFPSPAFPPRGRGRGRARFQVRLKNPDCHQVPTCSSGRGKRWRERRGSPFPAAGGQSLAPATDLPGVLEGLEVEREPKLPGSSTSISASVLRSAPGRGEALGCSASISFATRLTENPTRLESHFQVF